MSKTRSGPFNLVCGLIPGFLLLWATAAAAVPQEAPRKHVIKAICLPLADHYPGIVALEKYGKEMVHADLQLEMMPDPDLVRPRFREDDADLAFLVCPMVLDMFAEKPDFRWVSLIHRDGNALAINGLLNTLVHLPFDRKARRPDHRVADAYAKVKKNLDRPSECAVPSLLATHTVVLYKYLRDHGKTLSLGRNLDRDVIARKVSPPGSPAHIKQQNSRSIPASFEQSLPWAEVVETGGFGHVAWYSKDVMNWPGGHVECIIIAKKEALRNRREAVREVIHAIHKAGVDIENARRAGGAEMDAIIQMIRKHIPAHTREAILQSLSPDLNAINYYNLNVDRNARDSLGQIMNLAVEGGILARPVDINALADTGFSTRITCREITGASPVPMAAGTAGTGHAEEVVRSTTGAAALDGEAGGGWNGFLAAGSIAGIVLIALLLFVIRRIPGGLPSLLRPGVARTLTLWMLVLVLVPLGLVSILIYRQARTSLQDEAIEHLTSVTAMKAERISSYFDRMVTDLEQLARNVHTVQLVSDLRAAFQESGKPLHDFVKAYQWEKLVHEKGQDLTTFRNTYGYNDVLLMDGEGNVLFTVARENDLGSNLFHGELAGTRFAAACRKALETGRPAFSDFAFYAPSNRIEAGFLASVLVNEEGDRVGVLAFQVPVDQIDGIMQQRTGLQSTGESYLVGADLRMRSSSPLVEEPTILADPVETVQTRTWVREHGKAGSPLKCEHEIPHVYAGPRGRTVIGVHRTIEVGGIRMGVIAEIEETEATAPAMHLQNLVLGLLTAKLLVILLLILPLTGRIVRPIQALSRSATRIAAGDLSARTEVLSRDEIGALGATFNRMADQLEQRTRITRSINRVFREALTSETEEEVARVCLATAEELTGSKFGWIGEINGAGSMDTIAISNPGWGACDMVVSDAKNFIKNMPIRGLDRCTLREGKSRIVNGDHIATHPDRVGTPAGHPEITSFLGVPFKREEKTVGMIALANKEGGYTQQDREAVETLAAAFYEALIRKRAELQVQEQADLRDAQAELSEHMQGALETETLCRNILTCLCNRLQAETGVLYLAGEDGTLRLAAGHARSRTRSLAAEYRPGEGLVGQAALEGKEIHLTEVPEDYFLIESGLGATRPRSLFIKPVVHNGRVRAVIELGTLEPITDSRRRFLESVLENIALGVESAESRTRVATALAESQKLSEELKAANEEMEEYTQQLQRSQEKLRAQQEELQVTNEELEEKNDLLEHQKREVEAARKQIQEKAEEVSLASKYKSEFLANMSHELRTPLNSLLLLAQDLVQNKTGNLAADQVESARIIHDSGRDLLNLINEILDLAKIEAGHMDLHIDPVRVRDIADGIRGTFGHLAEENGLDLEVRVMEDAPAEISSDRQRIEQVLRNFLSNAIKFTESGGITVTFGRPEPGSVASSGIPAPDMALAIAVRDTGIGIAPGEQKAVFEAFQQGDGGTTRRYGGTGLGLSISRELAALLGGEIRLESEPGQGTTFTLLLPLAASQEDRKRAARPSGPASDGRVTKSPPSRSPAVSRTQDWIEDDRQGLQEDDRAILVIEDDRNFARVLRDHCRARHFKCVAAPTGEAGLVLIREVMPAAVILDLRLPGMSGWDVLDAVKGDPRIRHIPVHIMSVEEATDEARRKGAVGFLSKPVDRDRLEEAFRSIEDVSSRRVKRLLVVEDDEVARRSIVELLQSDAVEVDEVVEGDQALEALRTRNYDCVVLDLGLQDMGGQELLERLAREGTSLPPVIVYTARDLTREEEARLMEHAESIILKDVRSRERLLDEVSLFLHQVVSELPETKRRMIARLHDPEQVLQGKNILLVDDDMRTVFALSRLLTDHGLTTHKAENGRQALQRLEEETDIDLVLLDIMMPEMDGYETLENIRRQDRYRKLPVIMLTAKAMKEDRDRCMAAGASDYLAKPVDQERLLSMLRVWLYRGEPRAVPAGGTGKAR